MAGIGQLLRRGRGGSGQSASGRKVSGVRINGVFFTTALLDLQNERMGPLWPATVPLGITAATLTLVIRGSRGLTRRTGNPCRDLQRGFRLGAAGTGLMFALMWLWPTDLMLKLAFSLFMVPTTLAASWGMVSASRRLRDDEAEQPARV
jgi:hypothetical protein